MDHKTTGENGRTVNSRDFLGWIMLIFATAVPVYCKYFYTEQNIFPVWLKEQLTLIKSWPVFVCFAFYFIIAESLYAAFSSRRQRKDTPEDFGKYELMDPGCVMEEQEGEEKM